MEKLHHDLVNFHTYTECNIKMTHRTQLSCVKQKES